MAGRYHGEVRVSLQGERSRAQQHIPAARLLMGQVMEQAGFNGLTTHRLQRLQADGSQIIAEKIGNLARVSIHAPGSGSGVRTVPRRGALLAGGTGFQGENVSPVILDHDAAMKWRAYFANTQAAGYYPDAGTYSAVFPASHPPQAGNCFHTNEDGLVTSWWSQAYVVAPKGRHPQNIYDRSVYCLGRPVLWLMSELRVLCAVIVDEQLYVLLADLSTPLDYPLRPTTPDGPGQAWASRWYSETANPTWLYRFALETKVIAATGHHYYAAHSGELISGWGLVRCYNRWTFDNATRQFVSVQLPRQPILRYVRGQLVEPPSNNEAIVRIGLDGQLSSELAGPVIFEEGGQQIHLVRAANGFDYLTPHGVIPALRTYGGVAEFNALRHAHCASGHYLMRYTARWPDAYPDTRNGYEGGQMVVYAQGEEQLPFSRGETLPTGLDPHGLIHDIVPDMTGSGIATLCYGAVGWPVFDPDEPKNCRGILDSGRLHNDHTANRLADSGRAVGGLSLGSPESADWPDGPRDTLRFDPATLAPVFHQHNRGWGNTRAAVCEGVLAVHAYNQWPASQFAGEHYFPGENLAALTGNTFRHFYFCPLGTPHRQQPRQVKA